MINSIDEYLNQLSYEMRNTDPATRQDALTDAEEHLRTALIEASEKNPDKDEEELLEEIISEYGMPSETAEEYRSLEDKLPRPTLTRNEYSAEKKSGSGFFKIFRDPKAWGALLYCLISLITGVLYFSWTVTGVAVSASLLILVIGIPIAMAFFFSFHGLAFVEGKLVEALLGERMPKLQRFFRSDMSWSQKIKRVLLGKDTWHIVIYQILMLPLGIVYFTLAVTLMSLSIALIASPFLELILRLSLTNVDHIVWIIPKWSLPLFSVLGVLLLKATLHIVRGIGGMQGKLAKSLLVHAPYQDGI